MTEVRFVTAVTVAGSVKFFASGVNFSKSTHLFVFLSLKLLKFSEIKGVKSLAWKSGGVKFWQISCLGSQYFSPLSSWSRSCYSQMILESEMGGAKNHAGIGSKQFERQLSGQVGLAIIIIIISQCYLSWTKVKVEYVATNKAKICCQRIHEEVPHSRSISSHQSVWQIMWFNWASNNVFITVLSDNMFITLNFFLQGQMIEHRCQWL